MDISVQWAKAIIFMSQERYNVLNHRPFEFLFNFLFELTSQKCHRFTSLAVCGGADRFPSQRTSNAVNVAISWRHLVKKTNCFIFIHGPIRNTFTDTGTIIRLIQYPYKNLVKHGQFWHRYFCMEKIVIDLIDCHCLSFHNFAHRIRDR